MTKHGKDLQWLVVTVVAVSILVFFSVTGFEFLNYDDHLILYKNPAVLQFDLDTILTKQMAGDFIPLTLTTFALENYFFGLNPHVFHITNILIHILNCVVVIFILYRLSNRDYLVTFLGSMAYTVCPLHVESVAWITERKDVLYGFFFLAALLSYLKYLDGKTNYYILSLIFLTLSLLSKSMAVTFPVILFLIDYLRNRTFKFVEKIPFFLLAVLMGLIQLNIQTRARVNPKPFDLFLALENISKSLTFYVSKFIWPTKLAAYYDAAIVKFSVVDVSLTILFLAMAIFIALKSDLFVKRSIVFGIALFLICIAPVLHGIPYGNGFIYADRYFYIPGLGLIFAFATTLSSHFKNDHHFSAKNILRGSIPVFLILTFISYGRVQVWANSEVLWEDVLENYPDTVFAFNNLGGYYLDKEKYDLAVETFEKSIIKNPNQTIYVNLGLSYLHLNRITESIEAYKKAVAMDPPSDQAYFGLGNALFLSGDKKSALMAFQECVRVKPNNADAYYNMGLIYQEWNDLALAKTYYEKTLSLNPKDPGAIQNLGVIKKLE